MGFLFFFFGWGVRGGHRCLNMMSPKRTIRIKDKVGYHCIMILHIDIIMRNVDMCSQRDSWVH